MTRTPHLAVLGLKPGCTVADARSAYHRLAKLNHPDLFPDEARPRQQLAMMRINEAYMTTLADLADHEHGVTPAMEGTGDSVDRRGDDARPDGDAPATFTEAWARKAKPGPPSGETAVGQLRDPAYAYYKQGFRYFKLGASELTRREGPQLRRYLATEGTADGYILRLALRALHYFERSYSYFLVVVDSYPASPWAPDARFKLRRLEKFSQIYQRICENLSRRSSMRRSSLPIVKGADPS